MTDTPLDTAFAAMSAAPDSDAPRLAFFERLAEAELFLLLKTEAEGETVEPNVFETTDGAFALVFDREERLTAFAEGPSPYAALSGRSIADMLAGRGIGLGLNLGVAPSSYLIPAEALGWLADTLSTRPAELDAVPQELSPPGALPETLLTALDARLAQAAGLAETAYLASAAYADGRRGHLLAVIDPLPGAEPGLARAVQEALTFSGLDAGVIDVTFLQASNPAAARLASVGLRFDLPKPDQASAPKAPGMDPNSPPRLK